MAFGRASRVSQTKVVKTNNPASFAKHFQPRTYNISRSPTLDQLIQAVGNDQLFGRWRSEYPEATASMPQTVYTNTNMMRTSLLEIKQDIQGALSSLKEFQEASKTFRATVWHYLDSRSSTVLRKECVHLEKTNELADNIADRLKDLLAIGQLIGQNGDMLGPHIFHAAVIETIQWCRITEAELYQSHVLLAPYRRNNDYFTKVRNWQNRMGLSELKGVLPRSKGGVSNNTLRMFKNPQVV